MRIDRAELEIFDKLGAFTVYDVLNEQTQNSFFTSYQDALDFAKAQGIQKTIIEFELITIGKNYTINIQTML